MVPLLQGDRIMRHWYSWYQGIQLPRGRAAERHLMRYLQWAKSLDVKNTAVGSTSSQINPVHLDEAIPAQSGWSLDSVAPRVDDDEATRDLDIRSRTSHAEQLHVMPCRSSGFVCRRSVTGISVATFGCSSISTAIVLSKYQLNLQ